VGRLFLLGEVIMAKVLKQYKKVLSSRGPKKSNINFRVTEAEKREVERTARLLNQTVSEYFLRLHRIAIGRLPMGDGDG